MKLTFRWYGENDPVKLEYIRQIPSVKGIVTAIYDVPPGEVWSMESIKKTAYQINQAGLSWEVVESVPVHEHIKLGLSSAKKYIDNYIENIKRLKEIGIKCICYNFMPVFDWLRSNLSNRLEDGSNALAYTHEDILKLNPRSSTLALPGWDLSYKKEELDLLFYQYEKVDEEKLWTNLSVFLNEIIPHATKAGIRMAIHPDDPPWSIWGLPRIITNYDNLKRFLNLYDSEYNGITLCTGSLGADSKNSLVDIIKLAKGKIPFVHMRNIKIKKQKDFTEVAHLSESGSIDMYLILKALIEDGFDGYIRPDHGRMIWDEKGKPGYGLYDRALGASYISGLYEGIIKNNK